MQQACAVTTRSQAKKAGERIPLKVPGSKESPVVDREKLKQMQRDDESLQKYWKRNDVVVPSFKNTASIFLEISFIQCFPLFSCKQYDVITDLICIIEKRQYF